MLGASRRTFALTGACRLPAGTCGVRFGGAGLTGRRVCRHSSKRAQQANCELSPRGIDKGVGVARALEYLGRTGNARTFGFGDSGNDLGMLAAVETAVAMGNAMPEVKAVADYVTDDVAHDGTVTAMRHFGLI
ncbi:HAD family hydrolase [Collinsella sp. OM08-14AT]|uniref:HAD family hydrolase n=1 Tax=Collinsella sp. OM08-14AT TaxID=2292329 RepID=UPI000E44C8CB|nr:HAD hydrolase family protein [Collinsella sp. OM08-14AT]RGM33254.1 hypothetical protein DXC18_03575 [Collinsella sp. OM08-14AT]